MTEKKSNISFEMYKWIKACRPYHLTLGDVLGWKKGEKVDVCMLDRNFEEYGSIWDRFKPNTPLPATTFFAKNKATLTYKDNLVWDISYDYGETIEHPVHFCTSSLATSWNWVELDIKKGYIKINSEMLKDGIPFPKNKSATYTKWQEFPKLTRVGWRGPMILWKHLNILPKVYWEDKDVKENIKK